MQIKTRRRSLIIRRRSNYIKLVSTQLRVCYKLYSVYMSYINIIEGKSVALRWFKKLDESDNIWVCCYGVHHIKSGLGFINLVPHVQQSHLSNRESNVFLYSTKSGKIYAWLNFIFLALLPFATVENQNITPFVVMQNIS